MDRHGNEWVKDPFGPRYNRVIRYEPASESGQHVMGVLDHAINQVILAATLADPSDDMANFTGMVVAALDSTERDARWDRAYVKLIGEFTDAANQKGCPIPEDYCRPPGIDPTVAA